MRDEQRPHAYGLVSAFFRVHPRLIFCGSSARDTNSLTTNYGGLMLQPPGSTPAFPHVPPGQSFNSMTQDKFPTSNKSDVLSRDGDRHARVLLAEDDRALRRFLQVVLERAGYEVVPAADGLEAMKLAMASPIDIVVTDAMMPNLSGHEFCRFLRNSQTLSDIPVILLSALERKEETNDQVNAFLAKPVSAESLIDCIESLLKKEN